MFIGKILNLNYFTTKTQALPKRVNGFEFVKLFQGGKASSPYSFGLYKDAEGKFVLAKQWVGGVKNLDYFWLKNEAMVYNSISQTEFEKDNKSQICIPHFRGVYQTNDSFILFIEYIDEASQLRGLTLSEFISLRNYLVEMGSGIDSVAALKRRGPIYYILMGFINCVLCMLRDPLFAGKYISGYVSLARAYSKFKQSSFVFTHRDLTRENIIVRNGDRYVIDFQFAIFTNKYMEIASTIVHCLEKTEDDRAFAKVLMNHYLNDQIEGSIYKAFVYYAIMYDQAISRFASTKTNREFYRLIQGGYYA